MTIEFMDLSELMHWMDVAIVTLPASDTNGPDRIGPDNPAHRAVHDVIRHLTDGEVIPAARKALGDALDKANAPPTGRAKSDDAIGRAVRFGGV